MINTRKYLSEVAEKIIPYQWEETGMEKTWRFDANTPPFPPKSLPFFLKTMAVNCPINEYADPSYTKLKQLIAGYEKVKPSMITVTNSGDEAVDVLAKTFLNPGDLFITSPPTYEVFSIQCEINRGKNLEVPLL
ncbi:aminotransferase class I/II-fold pyridoxal phosphate-dependent enzyme, partial [Candidatus Microgenomates bacterium]|nr:aminotransferase class I/II-fold pyridoxal phosphate-dependent enzyme [Candidatus Microgenomates bacterium]